MGGGMARTEGVEEYQTVCWCLLSLGAGGVNGVAATNWSDQRANSVFLAWV